VAISWRGDGAYFAVYSSDQSDDAVQARVRVYNSELELQSVGRAVGEGPAAVIKGLLPALAYSNNGGLIAVAQLRAPKKLYV
jgi:hypothetical protein